MLPRAHIPQTEHNMDMNFSITNCNAHLYVYMYIDVNLLIKEGRSHYSYDAPEEYNSMIKEQHDGPLLIIIYSLPL